MDSIIIPDADGRLRDSLSARVASHGQTLEAEARSLLLQALEETAAAPAHANLYDAIRAIIEPLGGIALEIPPRDHPRAPALFD